MMALTASAKPSGVHLVTLPQTMPSSSSTRYFTRVSPVPTTSVEPFATVNVPAPFVGVPSLVAEAAGLAAGLSAPALTDLTGAVAVGFGLAFVGDGFGFGLPFVGEGSADGAPAPGAAGGAAAPSVGPPQPA